MSIKSCNICGKTIIINEFGIVMGCKHFPTTPKTCNCKKIVQYYSITKEPPTFHLFSCPDNIDFEDDQKISWFKKMIQKIIYCRWRQVF